MNEVVSRLLKAVRLGEPEVAGGLRVIPVFSRLPEGPEYIALAEAMKCGSLVVSEIDDVGSVPELRARNLGGTGVLAVCGEELCGARQNRILNTTVYLPPGAETVVPVSCVEAGRWQARCSTFTDSGHIASAGVRRTAMESVSASLKRSERYRSDQRRVWREVEGLSDRHGVRSATRSMRDVMERRQEEIDELLSGIEPVQGQCGVAVVQRGAVLGMDIVSRPEVYRALHARILRSFVIDALGARGEPSPDDLSAAKRFLVHLVDAESTKHRSPPVGASHRFASPGSTGAVLTLEGAILHAGFLGHGTTEDVGSPGAVRPGGRKGTWGR